MAPYTYRHYTYTITATTHSDRWLQLISIGGWGVTPGNSLWGCQARFPLSWPYFRPKNVIFHTCFETWPLGRNSVIITWINVQTKKFFKSIANLHISISFLFIWNWYDNYVHINAPVVPLKTLPDSRPKWAKCKPVLRPKRPKNPTLSGGTYLYGFHVVYKEVTYCTYSLSSNLSYVGKFFAVEFWRTVSKFRKKKNCCLVSCVPVLDKMWN